MRYIKFFELKVTDQDRALAFYTGPMGLKAERDEPYQGGARWIELSVEDASTRLLLTKADRIGQDNTPALLLVCDDVDSETSRLASEGVSVMQEPEDAPWLPGQRYSLIVDSEGNTVMLSNS